MNQESRPHRNAVCVLTASDAGRVEGNGEMPTCRTHEHVSLATASRMTGGIRAEARIVKRSGGRAITRIEAWDWRQKRSGNVVVCQRIRL